jgi:hypothetical protein
MFAVDPVILAISRVFRLQIPLLQAALGDDLRVLALNYGDLIEQAFRDHPTAPSRMPSVMRTTMSRTANAASCICTGIWGETVVYRGRSSSPRPTTYRWSVPPHGRNPRSISAVRTALMDSTLVFVGTSLLDPNVIRYLYGVTPPSGSRPARFAIFVRQGSTGKWSVTPIASTPGDGRLESGEMYP